MEAARRPSDSELESVLEAAAAEVDLTLLRWSRSLTIRQRLRAATKALSRFRRVAPEGSCDLEALIQALVEAEIASSWKTER